MTPDEIVATIREFVALCPPLYGPESQPALKNEIDAALQAAIDIEEWTGEVHDILNAVRELTGTVEESGLPETQVERMREAYGALCGLYHEPLPLPEGQLKHEASPERDVLGLLSVILDFHAGDRIQNSAIVIAHHEWQGSRALIVTTEAGRNFAVTVSARD